jgi:soluble lytic murein transglycosylase-like protein
MYIPHISCLFKAATKSLSSTLCLLALVLIPLQACSNIESLSSVSPELPIVLNNETFKQEEAAQKPLVTDDTDSVFAAKASSYMKRVNKNLSDNDARAFAVYINRASEEYGVDKHLLLALIRIESRFNRTAKSPDGAKGLTQVIPRYHRSKIAEAQRFYKGDLFHPGVSIFVGASAFRECIQNTRDISSALLCYNGSQWDRSKHYAKLVLGEYRVVKAQVL